MGVAWNCRSGIFAILFIMACQSCYFERDKPPKPRGECCTAEGNPHIVFFSTRSGSGDIYKVAPDGSNLLPVKTDFIYSGSGAYSCGDLYTDLNGNGHYDPQESFIDSNGNKCRDDNEFFFDSVNNGKWDSSLAEPFLDSNVNGIYDTGEVYTDLNGNGYYDPQERSSAEPFQDSNSNELYDCGEAYTDLNGNRRYDPQDLFTDTNSNGCWDSGETFWDLNGNGKWDPSLAEPFLDSNNNGIYDCGETYTDTNGNGHYDPFVDYNKNNECDPSLAEPFQDSNGNGIYDCGEIYTDSNGNGYYDPQEAFMDFNGDKCRDTGEIFFENHNTGRLDSSLAEPFQDSNNNGIYDCGEIYDDLNGDGRYTPQESFVDSNSNGCLDEGEGFNDLNGNDKWDSSLAEPFIKYTGFPSTEKMPSCNSKGTEILFISNMSGYYEIYKMDIFGNKTRQLTNDRDGHSYPVFSPDDSRIAYVFTSHSPYPPHSGKNQIFAINRDGTGKIQITNSASGACCPSWSSDGSKIAYIDSAYWEVYIINSDGSGKPQKVPNVTGAKGPTGWANGDREILYWLDRDYWNNIPAKIYLAPVNGAYSPYSITDASSDNFNPGISRARSHIVFISTRSGSYEIYTSDISGTDTRRLTETINAYNDFPAWCP